MRSAKLCFRLIVIGFVLMAGAAAQARDNKYFELREPVVTEVTEGAMTNIVPAATAFANCNTMEMRLAENPLNPLDQVSIMLDQIINLGKKVWSVLENGRPVVNIKTDTASALPKGVYCWADLAGWSPTQSKVFKVAYENAYGIEVVNFAFRVVYTTGGNYNGQGRYITNTTVIPAQVDVAWGFTLNAASEVPMVFNAGTVEQPIGGMQLNMKWSVDTVIKHSEQTDVFYVGGDGTFKHLD